MFVLHLMKVLCPYMSIAMNIMSHVSRLRSDRLDQGGVCKGYGVFAGVLKDFLEGVDTFAGRYLAFFSTTAADVNHHQL